MLNRSIEARQGELEAIQGEFLPISKNLPKAHNLDTTFTDVSDKEIADKLEKLKQDAKFHAAFVDGDFGDFEDDQSLADFYICVELVEAFGPNVDLIDTIIMESELMREKWVRPTSGTTYGRYTIKNAIAAHAHKQEQKKLEDAKFCKMLEEEYGPPITDAEWNNIQEQTLQDEDKDISKNNKPLMNTLKDLISADMNPTKRVRMIMECMNKEHAYIIVGGKSYVIHDNGDEIFLLPKQVFYDKYAPFTTAGRNPSAKAKNVSVAFLWFNHENRRVVIKIVFKPEMACADDEYNLWKGFAIKQEMELVKAYDQCKKFLYHIKEVICGGDDTSYKYLMSWLAHMIQKPWEKPGVAIVMKSGEGTGKNTFTRVLGQIIGNKHYLETSSREVILGQFNAATEGKILINLSEAFWAGDKRLIGALKTLITDIDRSIERKGVDAYMIECFCRVMMSSNENWVIPASADSRRFCALNVSDKHKQDTKYFEALHEEINNGVAEAFYTILKRWEITENVRVAPKTKALIEQKRLSFSPVEVFWSEILDDGVFPNASKQFILEQDKIISCPAGDWPSWVHIKPLHGEFLEFCQRQRLHTSTQDHFSKNILDFIGLSSKERRTKTVQGSIMNLYAWPSHLKCQELWEVRLNGGQ